MQIPDPLLTISPSSGWEMQQLNPAEQKKDSLEVKIIVACLFRLEGVEISQNTVLLLYLLFAVGKKTRDYYYYFLLNIFLYLISLAKILHLNMFTY